MNRNRKQITFNLRCSPPPGFVFKFKNSNNSFSEDIGGGKKKKSFLNQSLAVREDIGHWL